MTKEQRLDSIEERLKQHARSFEGLLSLIPAKHYYEQDTTDQWRKKKQTKEEARAAKMAKLNPDSYKSAQDVLNEQQAEFRKRKRTEARSVDDNGSAKVLESLSGEKFEEIDGSGNKRKKLKIFEESKSQGGAEDTQKSQQVKKKSLEDKATEKAEKRRRKREKRNLKRANKKDKTTKKREIAQKEGSPDSEPGQLDVAKEQQTSRDKPLDTSDDIRNLDESDHESSLGSHSSRSLSPGFDAPLDHSGSSSITSLPPPSPEQPSIATLVPTSKQSVSHAEAPDSEELKRRLQARIAEFRTARKANDPQSLPQSRQELIDSRRQKEEARKAKKKELRTKLKEEEAQKRADTLARGSPLLSPGSPLPVRAESNQYAFGNVEFNDGQKLSSDLSNIVLPRKAAKGPSDPATALLAAQKAESRLASLDEAKRDDVAEKDSWLNARKRAQGERIRDDSSLLKKTLKRKQSQKRKSEKEWQERIDGVKKREEIKQKKREANLKQRRDEKGGKGKKSKGSKARPGFEGSFRAKAPSGKGKKS